MSTTYLVGSLAGYEDIYQLIEKEVYCSHEKLKSKIVEKDEKVVFP